MQHTEATITTRAGIALCCFVALASAGNIVKIPGVNCGYFDVIDQMTLLGFNTKTIDDTTAYYCIEACAKETSFYCRFNLLTNENLLFWTNFCVTFIL